MHIKKYIIFEDRGDLFYKSYFNDTYATFLKWLFEVRDIEDHDLEITDFFLYLRRMGKFDSYRYMQDEFNNSRKAGADSLMQFLKLENIEGSTLDHIEWATRLRLDFLLNMEEYPIAQFFADNSTLSSLKKADFWINRRRQKASELQGFIFNLSDKYMALTKNSLDAELIKKKNELSFLNFLYSI